MGSSIRKLIRIYPKKGSIEELDGLEICSQINKYIRDLSFQIQYHKNIEENYLEIQYCAEDGMTNYKLNFSKYHVWELISTSNGESDFIKYRSRVEEEILPGEKAIFHFDRLELFGNQDKLKEFYGNVYDVGYRSRIHEMLEHPIDNKVIIEVQGIYTSDNECEIGDEESQVAIRSVEQLDYGQNLKYLGNESGINTLMFYEPGFYLKEFLFDEMGRTGLHTAKTDFLDRVTFYHENKLVKEYIWINDKQSEGQKYRYGEWECWSADYWDNCINPKWIKFKGKIG